MGIKARFAIGFLLAGVAAPTMAATFIDSTQGYATTGAANLYNGVSASWYPVNYEKNKSYGAIYGSWWTGHYGAKVTGGIKAKFGFDANLSFSNTVNSSLSGTVRTVAGGQTAPGTSFVLNSTFAGVKSTSNIGGGQIDASLNAAAYAGAYLHAKACIVACKEGDLVNIGAGKKDDFKILGYHSATNSVDFLDKSYKDALPKYFQSDTLPLTAKLEAVNVGGTAKGGNYNTFHTEQQFAGAYLDVAKTLVQAFGLPNEVISGSVLGFDYTTISAKVGIGINAIYDVYTQITDKYTNYAFSTPVQVYDSAKQKWNTSSRKSITLRNNDTLVLRTVDPTASLSILPTVINLATTEATMKINVTAEDHVALLQVSGYGLSAGPLYKHDDVVELGTLGQFTAKKTYFFKDTVLAPLTLDFQGAANALALTDDSAAGMLSRFSRVQEIGKIAFVFVPQATNGAPGDVLPGTIEKVLNYETSSCNARDLSGCVFDREFTGVPIQERLTRDATGAPMFSYAVDFGTVDRLEALEEGTDGVQSTPESIRALLASLPPPGSNGYQLDPFIANNSTPFMGIPEPSEWMLMLAGFGILGAVARRRRQAQVKVSFN